MERPPPLSMKELLHKKFKITPAKLREPLQGVR